MLSEDGPSQANSGKSLDAKTQVDGRRTDSTSADGIAEGVADVEVASSSSSGASSDSSTAEEGCDLRAILAPVRTPVALATPVALSPVPSPNAVAGAALLTFTDPALCRATRLTKVLSGFGRVLQNSEGSAATYQLSEQVDHIDTFISHNWAIGRPWKLAALCVHFNFERAFAAAIFTMVCSVTRLAITGRRLFFLQTSATMTFVFLMVLFLGHHLDRFRVGRGRVVFLDKTCIHQTDKQLMRQGIENLSAFVANSSELLMCYSDLYLRKLWTVYEVATLVILRRTEDMSIVPIDRPFIVIMVLIAGYARFAASSALQIINHTTVYKPGIDMEVSKRVYAGIAFVTITTTSLIIVTSERRRRDVLTATASFDIHQAHCAVPSDRELVLKNCLVLMRQQRLVRRDLPDNEVLEAFNDLVRKELPLAFQASMGRVGMPYKVLCLSGLITEVYDDTILDMREGIMDWDDGICVFVGLSATMLCWVPLAVACTVRVEQVIAPYCPWTWLRFVLYVFLQLAASSCTAPGSPFYREFLHSLDKSHRLVAVMVTSTLLAVLTWLSYRQAHVVPGAGQAQEADPELGKLSRIRKRMQGTA